MRIFETIKDDHRNIRSLLDALLELSPRSRRRLELCVELRTRLHAHSKAEEAVFYRSLESSNGIRLRTSEALDDHWVADELAQELVDEIDGDGWMAKLLLLKETLELHMEAEEHELFAHARRNLSRSEAERMSGEFTELKDEVVDVLRAN